MIPFSSTPYLCCSCKSMHFRVSSGHFLLLCRFWRLLSPSVKSNNFLIYQSLSCRQYACNCLCLEFLCILLRLLLFLVLFHFLFPVLIHLLFLLLFLVLIHLLFLLLFLVLIHLLFLVLFLLLFLVLDLFLGLLFFCSSSLSFSEISVVFFFFGFLYCDLFFSINAFATVLPVSFPPTAGLSLCQAPVALCYGKLHAVFLKLHSRFIYIS